MRPRFLVTSRIFSRCALDKQSFHTYLYEHLGKPSSATCRYLRFDTRFEIRRFALLPTNFSCGHHWSKTFLTNTTAMDSQEISKIQSKLLVKPKTIQSLSGCKNHAINLLNSSNLFWDTPDFRIPWSKKSCPFWA